MSERGATRAGERITNLDVVRGVAVLGILTMNVTTFFLPLPAYANISLPDGQSVIEWLVGAFGVVFFDQKFMGLFSALFGAGIVLFADRAAAKGRRPWLLSLWRNLLLLIIGFLHSLVWEGDVLMVYAVAAPVLIALRKLKPRTLYAIAGVLILSSLLLAVWTQGTITSDGSGLGWYWGFDESSSEAVDVFFLVDYFTRSIAMMLVGVGLYRTGIFTGDRPVAFYRRLAVLGFGIGVPLAAAGVIWVAVEDFSPDVAIVGLIPNTIGMVPMVLGYVGLIILWNRRGDTSLIVRLRAAGRMALTNYLTQTLLGVAVLSVLLWDVDLSRTGIAVFVVGVWILQIWWSKAWLDRFRFGPFEWAWRVATYRKVQPLRR